MSKRAMVGPVFAMDGFSRPLGALANSSTRSLTPPTRPVAPVLSPATSPKGTGVITLGQLAQSKPAGIK